MSKMNVKTRNTLSPILLAAALGVGMPMAAMAAEPQDMSEKSTMERAGDYVADSALTTKVKTALLAEDDLSALDISVETHQGVVTLTGAVESDAQIELAERVVTDLDGVKDVNNRLIAKQG